MQEQSKARFPKGSDSVIKMFTDKDYFLKKYEQVGATNIQLLDHELDGDHFSIEVRRDVPADVPVPAFAKKFMSGTMTVVQRDTWDAAAKTGQLQINLKGVPVSITCDMELVDEGEGCTLVLNFDARASIPLIGKKVERLVLDDIIEKIDADTAVGVKLLADYE